MSGCRSSSDQCKAGGEVEETTLYGSAQIIRGGRDCGQLSAKERQEPSPISSVGQSVGGMPADREDWKAEILLAGSVAVALALS